MYHYIIFSWLHSKLDNLCFFKGRLKAVLRKGSEASGVSNLEYDTVKQERDMFKEENQKSRMTMDNPRLELSVNLLYSLMDAFFQFDTIL